MIRAGPPLPPRVSGSQWMSLSCTELNAVNNDGSSASGGEIPEPQVGKFRHA